MSTYYLSNDGNDANAGTSMAAPWATIDKLNSVFDAGTIVPGDSILFKRGDVFYGSPTHSGHFPYPTQGWMTYGPYGSGDKPKISCYKVASIPGAWQDMGNNVWRLDLSVGSGDYTGATSLMSNDVGHIRVDGVIHGVKRNSLASLANQWDFYSGDYAQTDVTSYVYVKSTGNPSTGRVIEFATQNGAVINVQRHRTLIHDLELLGGDGGVYGNSYWAPHDVIVRNCDIHDIGGGYLPGYGSPTRGGNGIQAWIGNTDWLIERNRIWNCYDVAVTYQGGQGVQVSTNTAFTRLHARRNQIWNNCQSFEIWASGTTGEGFVDCSFTDNLCFNAGAGWGYAVRPDPQGRGCHVLLYEHQLPVDLTIERNVFFDVATNYLFALNGVPEGLVLRDNAIYLAPGTLIQDSVNVSGQRSETVAQSAAYVAATGREQGSVWFSVRSAAEDYLELRQLGTGRIVSVGGDLRRVGDIIAWPAE